MDGAGRKFKSDRCSRDRSGRRRHGGGSRSGNPGVFRTPPEQSVRGRDECGPHAGAWSEASYGRPDDPAGQRGCFCTSGNGIFRKGSGSDRYRRYQPPHGKNLPGWLWHAGDRMVPPSGSRWGGGAWH